MPNTPCSGPLQQENLEFMIALRDSEKVTKKYYIKKTKKQFLHLDFFLFFFFNHKLIKKKGHGERIPRIHRFVEES